MSNPIIDIAILFLAKHGYFYTCENKLALGAIKGFTPSCKDVQYWLRPLELKRGKEKECGLLFGKHLDIVNPYEIVAYQLVANGHTFHIFNSTGWHALNQGLISKDHSLTAIIKWPSVSAISTTTFAVFLDGKFKRVLYSLEEAVEYACTGGDVHSSMAALCKVFSSNPVRRLELSAENRILGLISDIENCDVRIKDFLVEEERVSKNAFVTYIRQQFRNHSKCEAFVDLGEHGILNINTQLTCFHAEVKRG